MDDFTYRNLCTAKIKFGLGVSDVRAGLKRMRAAAELAERNGVDGAVADLLCFYEEAHRILNEDLPRSLTDDLDAALEAHEERMEKV